MSARKTRNSFDSPAEKYIQYNFQRPEFIDSMLTVLRDQSGRHPRVIALSGETGIGRRYLLEATAYLANNQGVKALVARIDLDGYANEGTTAEDYANHLLANSSEHEKSRLWEAIKGTQLELKAKAGFATCAFLSLAVGLKLPWDKLLRSKRDLAGPSRPGYELLDRLISYLTRKAKLVVHVTDNDLLASTWRRWLLASLGRHGSLIVAFSCDSIHDFQEGCPDREFVSLTLGPHDRKTFRSIIDHRFAPNTFPDALYGILWRYSRGYSADMARILKDLTDKQLICWDGERWRLVDDNLESERFTAVFAPAFYEPFDALRDELPADMMAQLETFTKLAALCGSYVPSDLIMKFMGLTLEESDALGDLIDERLVENAEDPVFEDLQAVHPCFEEVSLYRWKNKTLRAVFLQRCDISERRKLAAKIMAYLKDNLPLRSRGVAKLYLELSRFFPEQHNTAVYHNCLAWWVGSEEAEELSESLSNSVRSGRRDPQVLWYVVAATRDTWPAYRRFAVLEAFSRQPGGVPYAFLDAYYAVRTDLLHRLARYPEAEETCRILLARREHSLGRDHPQVATSLHGLAIILQDEGNYDESEPLSTRALAIRKKTLGPEHPDTAASLVNLAGILRHRGNYDEAEPLLRRALAIREKVLGPDHVQTATSLNNLGGLLLLQGNYDEAETLLRRALAIREKSLSPGHPDTANNLANLAVVLVNQGKYGEAEPLLGRALAVREAALGPNHPDVAVTLNNLAAVLQQQGKYEDAEPAYRRTLSILTKVLGPNHSDVAKALGNVAAILHNQGKYDEAEPLCRRALAICETVLEPDHPELANSLTNLAGILYDQGNYHEAEPPLRRALGIREKVLGSNHPDTAHNMANLATLLAEEGRYKEAEPLSRQALAISEEVLGPDHPEVAAALTSLARILDERGKYQKAETLCERALAIREKTLGSNHPDVGDTLSQLARILQHEGRHNEADAYSRRALAIREETVGPNHPDVAASLADQAGILDDRGRYEEAETLCRRALAISETVLRPGHPDVAASLYRLARVLQHQGKYAEAGSLAKRALDIVETALGPEHASVAHGLNNLAEILGKQGNDEEAGLLHRRALAIREKVLGRDHPMTQQSRRALEEFE